MMERTKWETIGIMFDEGASECSGCQFYQQSYSSEFGTEATCALMDDCLGPPEYCPAFQAYLDEIIT